MNPITKKKVVQPKIKTGKVPATRNRQARQAAFVTPSRSAKSLNGVRAKASSEKEYAEFLIYKELKAEVAEFYAHPGLWLEAPHPMLGGESPLQIALASPDGKDLVLNLIQMIKAGMFT